MLHLNRRVSSPPHPFSFDRRQCCSAVRPLLVRRVDSRKRRKPEIGFSICHQNVLVGVHTHLIYIYSQTHMHTYTHWHAHVCCETRDREILCKCVEPCGRRQKLIKKKHFPRDPIFGVTQRTGRGEVLLLSGFRNNCLTSSKYWIGPFGVRMGLKEGGRNVILFFDMLLISRRRRCVDGRKKCGRTH